jgi:hypothetical protein
MYIRIEDFKNDEKIIQKFEYLLKCNQKWSPEIHSECSKSFKQTIQTFLLCMKCNQNKTKLKIPKFVLFEIIKVIDQKSFFSFGFSRRLND